MPASVQAFRQPGRNPRDFQFAIEWSPDYCFSPMTGNGKARQAACRQGESQSMTGPGADAARIYFPVLQRRASALDKGASPAKRPPSARMSG